METASNETLTIKIDSRDLPVLSTVATRAIAQISDGDCSVKDLEELIRSDQSIASRILRLSNSPLYGGKVKISSIAQAVVRLGMARLKNTILIAATGDVFDRRDPYARALGEHALAVGLTSKWLSERLRNGDPEEAFVAGMLHDVGKVVIYRQQPKFYGALMDEAAFEEMRFYRLERARINFCSHESIGALVARKWNLDSPIIEAIRFHHDIENGGAGEHGDDPWIALISAANLLANELGFGAESRATIEVLGSKPAEIVGIDEPLLDEIHETLPPFIEDQQTIFQ